MGKEMINESLIFDYIKLGTDVGKLFLVIACYREDCRNEEEYWQIVDICNERLKKLAITYEINANEIIDSKIKIDFFDISNHFTEPFLSIKNYLYQIGYNLILFALVNENGETEELNKKDLYNTFKSLLNKLNIPSYDVLEILFDNQTDIDARLSKFSYSICTYLKDNQENIENNNTVNNYDSIVIIGGTNNDGPIVGKIINSKPSGEYEKLFSELIDTLKKHNEIDEEVLKKVEEMQNAIGSREYNTKYKEFISSLADHATIIGPFIDVLTQLILD